MASEKTPTRDWLWPVGLGLLVLSVVAYFSLGKGLLSDESEMVSSAYGLLLNAKSIYYNGDIPAEYRAASDSWVFQSSPVENHPYSLWHTTLYLHALTVAFVFFGVSSLTARAFGLVCVLATFWCARRVIAYQTNQLRQAGGVAAWQVLLSAFNPFLLQIGFLATYDNTMVPLSSYAFLSEYIRLDGRKGWPSFVWLVFLLLLCFWSKEYSIVFVGAAIFLWECGRRQTRGVVRSLALLGVTVPLCVLTWQFYCGLQGFPAEYLVRVHYANPAGSAFQYWREGGVIRVLLAWTITIACSLSWTSIFFALLVLMALFWRVQEFRRSGTLEGLDLLVIFSCLYILAAKFVRPSLLTLRYEYPCMPGLILLISFFLERHLGRPRSGWMLGALGLGVLHFVCFDDVVLWTLQSGRALHAFWTYAACSLTLWLVPSLVFRRLRTSLLICAILLCSANLGLTLAQCRPYVTSADWLVDYGSAGPGEVVQRLQQLQVTDLQCVLPKGVGFLVSLATNQPRLRWINDLALEEAFRRGPQDVIKLLAPVRYVVGRENTFSAGEALQSLGFRLEMRAGGYVLFSRPPAKS